MSIKKQISIVIPTYNERNNIALLCNKIATSLDGKYEYELIFVDDNSPDGTYEEINNVMKKNSMIHLIKREGKLGLGSAVRDGFNKASGDYCIMMDADLSHDPIYLPDMIKALDSNDVVIGSRHVKGGGVKNWPFYRKFISSIASYIARLILTVPVKDITSGFAGFRKEILEDILTKLTPKGFKILVEIIVNLKHAKIKEIPIIFVDRQYGKSKLSIKEIILFLLLCFKLRKING